jgi:hypothetical protein
MSRRSSRSVKSNRPKITRDDILDAELAEKAAKNRVKQADETLKDFERTLNLRLRTHFYNTRNGDVKRAVLDKDKMHYKQLIADKKKKELVEFQLHMRYVDLVTRAYKEMKKKNNSNSRTETGGGRGKKASSKSRTGNYRKPRKYKIV